MKLTTIKFRSLGLAIFYTVGSYAGFRYANLCFGESYGWKCNPVFDALYIVFGLPFDELRRIILEKTITTGTWPQFLSNNYTLYLVLMFTALFIISYLLSFILFILLDKITKRSKPKEL
jgi:hypothetical protein